MCQPKATIIGQDGVPWVARAVQLLAGAGADPVYVALGAEADNAARHVPAWSHQIMVDSWTEGIGASLRASLETLDTLPATVTAVLVTLVDLPEAQTAAATRVVGAQWSGDTLRRATFAGNPGHPVLIGRAHWRPLIETLRGDTGAQIYLRSHGVTAVDCTDIGGGDDVDSFPKTS